LEKIVIIGKILSSLGVKSETLVYKTITKTVDAMTICGDNGTSAIYATTIAITLLLRHFGFISLSTALGLTSLIIWTAVLVFYLYMFGLVYVTDLDGKIEGGSPAFLLLIRQLKKRGVPIAAWVSTLVLVMMALTVPDFWLTGAISLLAAFGGLKVAFPELPQYLVYGPACVVAVLFFGPLMSQGIGKINSYFGPITLVWFVLVSGFSIWTISLNPMSLWAFSPVYAINLLKSLPVETLLALFGALILIITGWEAAQLDRKDYLLKIPGARAVLPIQLAFSFNTITNILSVLAQCSLLLNLCVGKASLSGITSIFDKAEPRFIVAGDMPNLFFGLLPAWALFPMIAYAVVEVIIAATATTLGAQNLFAELHSLGLWYRMPRKYTNLENSHEFYVAPICNSLMFGCIALMLWAQSDEKLANAYGTSVVCGMFVGSLLAFLLSPYAIEFSGLKTSLKPILKIAARVFFAFFVILFVPYLLGGLSKVLEGSWITLTGALVFFLFLDSYRWGERRVNKVLSKCDMTVSQLYNSGSSDGTAPVRTNRIGLILTKPNQQMDEDSDIVPPFLAAYVSKHESIPSRLVSIAISTDVQVPNKTSGRFQFFQNPCGDHCLYHIDATYGWADKIVLSDVIGYANTKLNEELLATKISETGDSSAVLTDLETIDLATKGLFFTGKVRLELKPTTKLLNFIRFVIYRFIRSNLSTPFHEWIGKTNYDDLVVVNLSAEI
jgi:KUP system potassium uptake protein